LSVRLLPFIWFEGNAESDIGRVQGISDHKNATSNLAKPENQSRRHHQLPQPIHRPRHASERENHLKEWGKRESV